MFCVNFGGHCARNGVFLFVFVAVCEKRIASRKLLLDSLVTLVCYAKLRVADPLHWLCVTTLSELAAD